MRLKLEHPQPEVGTGFMADDRSAGLCAEAESHLVIAADLCINRANSRLEAITTDPNRMLEGYLHRYSPDQPREAYL